MIEKPVIFRRPAHLRGIHFAPPASRLFFAPSLLRGSLFAACRAGSSVSSAVKRFLGCGPGRFFALCGGLLTREAARAVFGDPMDFFSYKNGELYCEDVPVSG